jgi:DNA-binding CsgD family transcriptional regulator
VNTRERQIVKVVAKLGPWLAPVPSAFFVARSSMAHLQLPVYMAAVVAAMIEVLGLATVHTALALADYNAGRRKVDPHAPAWIAVVLAGAYVVTTIGLVVVLEVAPWLATYAPALFPLLAIVGAVNLALIANQERREAQIAGQKAEAKAERQARRVSKSMSKTPSKTASKTASKDPVLNTSNLDTAAVQVGGIGARLDGLNRSNASKTARKAELLDMLLDIYVQDPRASATEIARRLDIGRSTVYHYQGELERLGRVRSNGNGIEVL